MILYHAMKWYWKMHKTIWNRLDLNKSDKHEHPDIRTDGTRYLVKYNDRWHIGTFSRQWYGLNFNGIYMAGCQFDEPEWNSSEWQEVIEFDPEEFLLMVTGDNG